MSDPDRNRQSRKMASETRQMGENERIGQDRAAPYALVLLGLAIVAVVVILLLR